MGTIADKLAYIAATKEAIKNAIKAKGQTVSDSLPFRSYADKISAIETGSKPTITVSSSGLITATSGNFSNTKQLTTQGTKTWTPGTSAQGINAGTYVTGYQTILGDSDLVASNIKKGVQIFNVTGTYSGDVEYDSGYIHQGQEFSETSRYMNITLAAAIDEVCMLWIQSNTQGPASSGFDMAYIDGDTFYLLKNTGNGNTIYQEYYKENAMSIDGNTITLDFIDAYYWPTDANSMIYFICYKKA